MSEKHVSPDLTEFLTQLCCTNHATSLQGRRNASLGLMSRLEPSSHLRNGYKEAPFVGRYVGWMR